MSEKQICGERRKDNRARRERIPKPPRFRPYIAVNNLPTRSQLPKGIRTVAQRIRDNEIEADW